MERDFSLQIYRKGTLFLISLFVGLIGFLINSQFLKFQYMGYDFSLSLGSLFPLLIALKWGPWLSLPSAMVSASFLLFPGAQWGGASFYLFLAHTFWIPLVALCRVRELTEEKNPFYSYIVLFFYSLIHGLLLQVLFNPLQGLGEGGAPVSQQFLMILSYRDNMGFLSCLNLSRLLMLIPPFSRWINRRDKEGTAPGTGSVRFFLVITALFALWLFTLFGMAVVDRQLPLSEIFSTGFSGTSLMENLIYFNLVAITALVIFRNWEVQNDTARRMTERGDILTIILENIAEGVLVLSNDFKVLFANRAAIEMGRYSLSDTGRNIMDLVDLYDLQGESIPRGEAMESLIREHLLSCLLKTSLGSFKRITIQLTTLPESPYGYRYLALIRDTTEEYEMEQRNIHTQKQEAVGRLVGGVAHDFNNRLAGIMGFAQLIETEENRDKIIEYSEQIVASSQAAADLTNQLLTLSRKRPLQMKRLDLISLTEKLIPMLAQTLDKRVSLVMDKRRDRLPIKGDRSLLENSIINLAVNASHAMNKKGRISFILETRPVDDIYCLKSRSSLSPGIYAVLKVCDTGRGMDRDTKDRIFEPFFTTKGEGEGTGLGLSTVREIVEKHGGEVSVESRPGEGACFTLIFPLADARAD